MAESPTKKAKKEHLPDAVTATSIWDGLRVQAEGKEQALVGVLDEDGELGWLADDRDDEVAHFARKPWLAALLHEFDLLDADDSVGIRSRGEAEPAHDEALIVP